MVSLFLRRSHAPQDVIGPLAPERLLELGLSEEDCISLGPEEPFVPIGRDLDRNARLREVLLDAFPLEVASRFRRFRMGLFLGLIPMLLLVLLDLELFRTGSAGALTALSVDILTAIVVAVDLARPFPRHARVTSAVFGATALRFTHLIAARCAQGSVFLIYFSILAAVCSIGMLSGAPSSRAMADHVREALAMPPPTRLPTRKSPTFFRYIIYAVAAAALLPFLLWLLQSKDASLPVQLAAFLGFAVVVPYVGRVHVGADIPVHRDTISGALGTPASMHRPGFRTTLRALQRVIVVSIVTLILSFALVRGAQSAIETIVRTQSCLIPAHATPPALQLFLEGQRNETPPAGPSWLLLTVVVVPIAEELVYRGLVQHALRRRLKRRLAIGLSALLFGLAHVMVFPNAIHQTVLLGLSFGLAYERAGILASILVHMLWNLLLSV